MMMLLISTVFLAILFTVGFITTFLKIPTNKLFMWFHPIASVKATPALDKTTNVGTRTRSIISADKEELKGVFATFDKNDDGFITKQELKESLKNIGISMEDKDIAEMMEKVDENKDGLIDLHEFYELCNSFLGGESEREGDGEEMSRKEENLREAFEVFDEDTDGLITAKELSKVLGSLGLKDGKTLEDFKEMIGRFDLDGDGMVNFDEFKRMMTQRVIPIS
ncbi:PREDICTED: calmodulin-like protein 3 [Ipomoea nil]|uniref:calmodulin-like protein 3 n=1 Tax=Ipomoea nil TaxID=35883 RepID=UPI0009017598|nr:PREDICTED: calmodulin-like protein 3 [Ipomoea nil]